MTPKHRRSYPPLALAILALALPALLHADPVALKTTELGHGPTLVFVHGLGNSRSDWMPTARKLIGRYHVVMVDLPGHGESALPEPFSFLTVGAALDAVLARQNPDSTIIVAHQMGGRAALVALAAHPERARGLVLIDVPVGMPLQIDDQQKKSFLGFMDAQYEAVAKMMFSKLGRDTTQSANIYAMFTQTPPATVKAYVREGFYSDGNKDFKSLKFPARVLITSRVWKDDATAGSVLRALGWEDTASVVPKRLADTAYWVMKDQPDSLAAIINEYATARLAAVKK